jgi:hypothetical protein
VVKNTAELRDKYRQAFFDQAAALLPGLADGDSLWELNQTIGDRNRAVTEWQRRNRLEGYPWVKDSLLISLQMFETTPGARRIRYGMAAPIDGEIATYTYSVSLTYFRTGNPAVFRESVLSAHAEHLDRFIGEADPEYRRSPSPVGDMETALDALILRVCVGMRTALVLEKLYYRQRKRWDVVLRSMRPLARIIGIRFRPGKPGQRF